MPRLSYWMIGYGLLLIAAEVTGQVLSLPLSLSRWIPFPLLCAGGAMIVAAFAYPQGRRSLRLSGLLLGSLVPLGLCIVFIHDALTHRASGPLPMLLLSFLALISLVSTIAVYQLRPHDGVASRGYAVTFPRQLPKRSPTAQEYPRRSEAG